MQSVLNRCSLKGRKEEGKYRKKEERVKREIEKRGKKKVGMEGRREGRMEGKRRGEIETTHREVGRILSALRGALLSSPCPSRMSPLLPKCQQRSRFNFLSLPWG